MWYLTRPLRRSQRWSGIHTRTWSLCPSTTMALVLTKHSLRPMLVMAPLRGASGVGPKAHDSSARKRVFFLTSFIFVVGAGRGGRLLSVGGGQPDGLDARVGDGRRRGLKIGRAAGRRRES